MPSALAREGKGFPGILFVHEGGRQDKAPPAGRVDCTSTTTLGATVGRPSPDKDIEPGKRREHWLTDSETAAGQRAGTC